MARATEQEQKGSIGASAVTEQFASIGWGFAEITRHDNGIDLFLMARDDRLFDLGLTLGAQVKAGPTYFSEPQRDANGTVQGWWFRDRDGQHLTDLVRHGLPQLLVLFNLDTHTAHYVHVTADTVQSTGMGAKILVPADHAVDEAHRQDLLDIAATTRLNPAWEGTVWGGLSSLATADTLRYALIAPRLLAPHPNTGTNSSITPAQGIALLMQARVFDYERFAAAHADVPTLEEAKVSSDWNWRFVAALGHRLTTGQTDALATMQTGAPGTAARTAATVAGAAGLLEEDRPDEALVLLEEALTRDDATPVDHAWLTVQLARALAEVGQYQRARQAAASVQGLGRLQLEDVTASAIEGVASQLLFRTAENFSGDLELAIRGADTAVAWWRQQRRGYGLGAVVERAYQEWGRDTTVRLGAADDANDQLLAASLTATLIGDHNDWRYTTTMLGRDMLLRTDRHSDPDRAEAGLTTLRTAGAADPLKLAASRLVTDGPAIAAQAAASRVRLENSTGTTARTNLDLLRIAGPVMEEGTADTTTEWLLQTIHDPSGFTTRTRPGFEVESRLVDTLAGVLAAASPAAQSTALVSLLARTGIDDQLTADSWASALRQINPAVQTPELAHRAAGRAKARLDHDHLHYALLRMTATQDADIQQQLIEDITGGSLNALTAIADIRILQPAAVTAVRDSVTNIISETIRSAYKGTFAMGGLDAGDILALLNLCHPDQANWKTIKELLADGAVSPNDKLGCLTRLTRQAHQIPESERPVLADIATRLDTNPAEHLSLMGKPADITGPAAHLRITLGADNDEQARLLLALSTGSRDQRTWAAELAGPKGNPVNIGILAALINDDEPAVRAVAATALTTIINSDNSSPLAEASLQTALQDPGLIVPLRVAQTLAAATNHTLKAAQALSQLSEHPLPIVRKTSTSFRVV